MRIPIIGIQADEQFVLASEDGTTKVSLIEVIGQGGCGIAYKGIVNPDNRQRRRVCIVKEYFPLEENLQHAVQYLREKEGSKIKIVAASAELRQQELERQRKNVQQEIKMSNQLFFEVDGEQINNNPHFYQASELKKWGDSTYILLDTEKGETLKAILRENGKLTLQRAIHYIKMLLHIVEKYFEGENQYIHGDLKPENIWITDVGNRQAEGMVILDFGSVFCQNEYKMELGNKTEKEILEHAEAIIDNEGIGCSSDGYRSTKILDLSLAKTAFINLRDLDNAKKLIQAVNYIDSSVDIYSIFQMLFYLVTEREYNESGEFSLRKVQRLLNESDVVCQWLIHMMENNAKGNYQSVQQAEKDIDALERLRRKDADPRVLIEGLKKEKIMQEKIEETLLADVEEK